MLNPLTTTLAASLSRRRAVLVTAGMHEKRQSADNRTERDRRRHSVERGRGRKPQPEYVRQAELTLGEYAGNAGTVPGGTACLGPQAGRPASRQADRQASQPAGTPDRSSRQAG